MFKISESDYNTVDHILGVLRRKTQQDKSPAERQEFSTVSTSAVGYVHAGIPLIVGSGPQGPTSEHGGGRIDGPVVIVRAEEVLLVVLVLTLWVAAIALFFNRWGKIRMLEPYQPKFQQSHRPSCPLAPLSPPGITPQQRMSFSKYNVSCLNDYSGFPSPNPQRRPRQNSVFVGSSTMAFMNPPRRVKSAIDIQHLVLNEHSPSLSSCNSMLPMITPYRDRKPSISIERPNYSSRRKASIATSISSQSYHTRNRRPSCCGDRLLYTRHRNFTSFDQPNISFDRRTSIAAERPSCIVHQPTVSFETPSESLEGPFLVIEPPSTVQETALTTHTSTPFRKTSLSFEQPSVNLERTKQPRMATSLDINTINFARRSSMPDPERLSPVSITFDETKITAPLLEGLKSSDV
ncbi:hypothetical protein RN001_011915 [Aquatica leii]|uniref:Fibronectin type III domain-containing protein n=1 Tax=Aquatica leii TaxID=1421715 RepID=A0AAN7QEB0_9COLE|nr:hypothetical protein RN001_011915 [Aquatica leii]